MSNTELKTSTSLTTVGDGFDHYNDRVEGDEGPQQQDGVIRGSMVKFSATRNGSAATARSSSRT
jgi:hypothetical protein